MMADSRLHRTVRVLHYLELADRLERSGIGTAVAHQRAALAATDVEVVPSIWRDGSGSALRRALAGDRLIEPFDLAHCNMIGPGSLAVARLARRRAVPLVLSAHVTSEDFAESFRGSSLAARPLRRYLRWYYSQADLVICPSEHTKAVLADYPIDAPVRPITNGVDLEALDGATDPDRRRRARDRWDLEGLVVFTVGNVFERKGLTTFCELAELLEHRFAWFGPYDRGPQASRPVRRWTRNPPVNVTFTGWVSDVRDAYAAGDIYLFPTKAENQGIAVLEAMACGKPVVLRDLPVFREFYTHGEDCLMCGDFTEFRAAIERLVADPDLRDRLGATARETARDHGLDRVGDELAEAYTGLLDEA